jgi:phospholipase C
VASANRAAAAAAKLHGQGGVVMAGFDPGPLPVLSALTAQGAVLNYGYAPLPSPTEPNRFFVHAAAFGGLTQSPDNPQMTGGFDFAAGTIYERFSAANQRWRISHDGLPQAAGITSLRLS